MGQHEIGGRWGGGRGAGDNGALPQELATFSQGVFSSALPDFTHTVQ